MTLVEVLTVGLITGILMTGVVTLFYAHFLGYFTAFYQDKMDRECRQSLDDIANALPYWGGSTQQSVATLTSTDYFTGALLFNTNSPAYNQINPQIGNTTNNVITNPGTPFGPTNLASQQPTPNPASLGLVDEGGQGWTFWVQPTQFGSQTVSTLQQTETTTLYSILGQYITDIEFQYEYRYPNASSPGTYMFWRTTTPFIADPPDKAGIAAYYIATVYITVTASIPNPFTGTLIYRTMTTAVHFRSPYLDDAPRAWGT